MFSVIFEVLPNNENWDDYLDNAKMLRSELEQEEGFVDNVRYKSLTRDGWILSLSNWRDEKSLVRWRTRMRHHEVQQKGRDEILADYHLRVGQITADNQVPAGVRPRGAEARRDRSRRGNDGHADQRDSPRGVEADQQPVRLRRMARPKSVGRRHDVLGHLRRHTHARRPDSRSYPGRTPLQRRPTRTLPRRMTRQGSGECGSYVITGNTTVARRLSTTRRPRAARPSTPDTAPSERADLLQFELR